jgi:hypothetical protein
VIRRRCARPPNHDGRGTDRGRAWAARRVVRRPHAVSSSSWGRIRSASTIASASPSRTGSSRCVSVIILFTPFHPDVALLPVTGQALIAVFSSQLAILMRRGLAFSATGMAINAIACGKQRLGRGRASAARAVV